MAQVEHLPIYRVALKTGGASGDGGTRLKGDVKLKDQR